MRVWRPALLRLRNLSPTQRRFFSTPSTPRRKLIPPLQNGRTIAAMNPSRSTLCTEHRLARLIAWTRLVLVWIAGLFFNEAFEPSLRRLDRYGFISLRTLKRRVRNLIIIHAAQHLGVRAGANLRPRQDFAARGFSRRLRPRHFLRSIAGVRLRRALRSRDPATLISNLLTALREIDKLARSVARRLTRLAPLLVARPPCTVLRTLAVTAPCAADSS